MSESRLTTTAVETTITTTSSKSRVTHCTNITMDIRTRMNMTITILKILKNKHRRLSQAKLTKITIRRNTKL